MVIDPAKISVITSTELLIRLPQARETSDFRLFKTVITGFNTDIEHDGVVYHVQTEDKGLDSPLILSLVYSGGAILASKRSRYEDLIAEGFNEEVLAERLKRQHRLICAAINAGRLEDLKRMGAKPEEETPAPTPTTPEVNEPQELEFVFGPDALVIEPTAMQIERNAIEIDPNVLPAEPEAISDPTPEVDDETPEVEEDVTAEVVSATPRRRRESAYSVHDPRRMSPPNESGLGFTILDEDEFRAGQTYTIRVLVEETTGKKQKALPGVGVSVKILGTAFRPQIYSVKTERDGVAIVSTKMPSFKSGRAAVLIRAVVKGQPMEVRRIIHPAE